MTEKMDIDYSKLDLSKVTIDDTFDPNTIEDDKISFIVVVPIYKNQWVLCKNKKRKWEIPGGKVKVGETVINAAQRELHEESGLIAETLYTVCDYMMHQFEIDWYGRVYCTNVYNLLSLPKNSEMEDVALFKEIPDKSMFTFSEAHPVFLEMTKKTYGRLSRPFSSHMN